MGGKSSPPPGKIAKKTGMHLPRAPFCLSLAHTLGVGGAARGQSPGPQPPPGRQLSPLWLVASFHHSRWWKFRRALFTQLFIDPCLNQRLKEENKYRFKMNIINPSHIKRVYFFFNEDTFFPNRKDSRRAAPLYILRGFTAALMGDSCAARPAGFQLW